MRTILLQGADSVSEVALRQEINPLDRFFGRHKNHFGESLKTTLRRTDFL